MPLILMVETTDPTLRAHAGKRIEVIQRLSVGRGAENDLVLPDPGRVLSKRHCLLSFDGSGYVVTDVSTNGVYMNHGPDRLPRDVPTPLRKDDYLQLGDFGLVVLEASVPSGGARPEHVDDLDDLFGAAPAPKPSPAASPDPFDDLFEDRPPAPAPLPKVSPFGSPIDPGGPLDLGFGGRGASDDSMFGGPPGNAPPLAATGGLIPEDDDLFGPPPVRNNWKGGSRADHAPSEMGFFAAPKVSTEVIPDDWDPVADLGLPAAPSARLAPAPAPISPPPISPPPMASPFAEAPRPAPSPPASAAPTPIPVPGSGNALKAFLAAAGLEDQPLDEARAVKMMAMLGRTVRLLVEGMTEILAARASTKQEFRIERTMIGKLDNNPLKFSATTDEAMRVLLLQSVPGFLSAEQAFDQALNDIKSHQLAVLAGMQTALTTVIARFDPAQLEKRIEKSSLIEGVLPGARKARYWDLFRKLYGEIARELEDDLQSLFGAEFAAAYRSQIEKLQSNEDTE
ncbi:MAG TPA: type VI secretion system-associated FHA domain protein TagH [Aliidongia sp.]|nr:type VI secretion system-associated FHA domain protein TagH [Aliidongia sp.]